jgi:hypothetical protein
LLGLFRRLILLRSKCGERGDLWSLSCVIDRLGICTRNSDCSVVAANRNSLRTVSNFYLFQTLRIASTRV